MSELNYNFDSLSESEKKIYNALEFGKILFPLRGAKTLGYGERSVPCVGEYDKRRDAERIHDKPEEFCW
jgi:hypothetical protein